MLSKFFKQRQSDERNHGWHIPLYRFRGHAAGPFWRWVCSWARACRKPSDLGFDDDGFALPNLDVTEHKIDYGYIPPGQLFSKPAFTLREQRQERTATIKKRCEAVAESVSSHNDASVSWCHLNAEGDMLEKLIPEAKQVKGSMSVEAKEEILAAFQAGEFKRLVIKPKIGAFGLNWQHCHRVTTFPSHSYEQYYQAIRRCWRFGQKNRVKVDIFTTEGEISVLANLQRKAAQVDDMFKRLVSLMANEMHINHDPYNGVKQELPKWL
jgi:superfamily II DNA or RNA helicase